MKKYFAKKCDLVPAMVTPYVVPEDIAAQKGIDTSKMEQVSKTSRGEWVLSGLVDKRELQYLTMAGKSYFQHYRTGDIKRVSEWVKSYAKVHQETGWNEPLAKMMDKELLRGNLKRI